MRGVDADELEAAAKIDLDQLPAMRELAIWIGRFRQPYPRARRVEPDHGARIGAMYGHCLTRQQHDIGEETLVAFHERCGDERGGEAHEEANTGWRRANSNKGSRSRRPRLSHRRSAPISCASARGFLGRYHHG